MADDSDDKQRKQDKNNRKLGNISDTLQKTSDRLQDISDQDSSRQVREDDTPHYMSVPSFKRGGVMRKSGAARLHKGERAVKARGKKRGKARKGRE